MKLGEESPVSGIAGPRTEVDGQLQRFAERFLPGTGGHAHTVGSSEGFTGWRGGGGGVNRFVPSILGSVTAAYRHNPSYSSAYSPGSLLHWP